MNKEHNNAAYFQPQVRLEWKEVLRFQEAEYIRQLLKESVGSVGCSCREKNANGVGVGWGAGLAGVGSIGFKQEGWRLVLKNLDCAHTNTSLSFGVSRLGIFCQTVEYESKDLRAGNLLSLDNQLLLLL